ncbi:MAG: DUF4397 domain-containing protein [Actinomycetota bacterium]|nr:DUF4397 domain-containing protein [Actinomycetota bacterium]
MKVHMSGRWSKLAAVAAAALALSVLTVGPSYAAKDAKDAKNAKAAAEIYLVQGLPHATVDVSVDGAIVASGLTTAQVAGPFKVVAGSRKLTFLENGKPVLASIIKVSARSNTDVVVHLPAQAAGRPVVTTFDNDLSAVPKDKASLVVAHTAAVPPADVLVNGQVLFSNIANGESLKLVVPAAKYSVAIVPTGEVGPDILGPLALTVKGGSLNRVYAVGDPVKKTMNVAVHVIAVSAMGSAKPLRVNTGTGGQAVGLEPVEQLTFLH